MLAKQLQSLVFGFLALLPSAGASLHVQDEITHRFAGSLSAEEVRLARHLAEENWHSADRVYFIKTDLLPDSRQVNVIHYRYHDDETVITTVDLHTFEVHKVEIVQHFPTALAIEEKQRAERLARADSRCGNAFAGGDVQVDFRPIQIHDARHPLRHHRLVHVMPRHGADYLSQPRILVDLTNDTVLLDETT